MIWPALLFVFSAALLGADAASRAHAKRDHLLRADQGPLSRTSELRGAVVNLEHAIAVVREKVALVRSNGRVKSWDKKTALIPEKFNELAPEMDMKYLQEQRVTQLVGDKGPEKNIREIIFASESDLTANGVAFLETAAASWGGTPTKGSTSTNVIVVVDIQQNYCSDCDGVETDVNIGAGYGMPLRLVVESIAALTKKQAFDAAVVTQDKLPYGMRCAKKLEGGNWVKTKPLEFECKGKQGAELKACLDANCIGNDYRPLLTKGFPGADLVPGVTTALAVANLTVHLRIGKQMDDWLGKTATVGDERGSSAADAMKAAFCNKGNCSDVTLWITGIQTTRCILKGALHARGLGFNVNVLHSTTCGGGINPDEFTNWRAENARRKYAPWWQLISDTGSCSPTREKAFKLMDAAGITTSD